MIVGTKFQPKLTILTNSVEIEKAVNTTTEFCIFESVLVPTKFQLKLVILNF